MLTFRELITIGLTIACGFVLDAWIEERVRDTVAAGLAEGAVFLAVCVILRRPLQRLRATPGWWRLAPVGALVVGLVVSSTLFTVRGLLAQRWPPSWLAVLKHLGVSSLIVAALLTVVAFGVAGVDAWRARLRAAQRHVAG